MMFVKNNILVILFFVTAATCLLQLNAAKKERACYPPAKITTETMAGEVEDFSLLHLLTLKFM